MTVTTYEADSSKYLLVSEQEGDTPRDKLLKALSLAKRGSTVVGDDTLEVSLSSTLRIPSGVTLDGGGMLLKTPPTAAACVEAEPKGFDIVLKNTKLDMAGGTGDAVRVRGVSGFTVEGCWIDNHARKAVDVAPEGSTAARDIRIVRNFVTNPRDGVAHVIVVRSGIGGEWVTDVVMEGNVCHGSDLEALIPPLEDYTPSNKYTADYLLLQGVRRASVFNNTVRHSGSAGISVARCVRDITIKDNHFENCFEPAINVGSSYETAHVADISPFYLVPFADQDVNTNGITSVAATVTSGFPSFILPDPTGAGGWLGLETVGGGHMEEGDDITQTGASHGSTLTPAPIGARDEGESRVYTAERVHVVNNLCEDVVRQGLTHEAAAINFIHARGGNTATGNRVSNPRGLGHPKGILGNSNSIVSQCGNYGDGDLGLDGDYVLGGTTAAWLAYVLGDPLRNTEVARGTVTGAGSLYTTSVGISAVVKQAVGVYSLALPTPLDDVALTQATAQINGGGAFYATSAIASESTVTVRTYDKNGDPADKGFFVSVNHNRYKSLK